MGLYYVRTHKRWLGTGGHPWVNSYEVLTQNTSVSTPGIDPTDVSILDAFINALVSFEIALHVPSVYFERVVVSTWIADSNPYNGNELMSRPQGIFGTRVAGDDREDLRFCLAITRTPVLGNPGKLPLRGVLTEGDKAANAQGIAQLVPGSDLREGGGTWLSAEPFIEDYYTGGANSADCALVMIHSPTPETYNVRGVTQLRPLGVAKVDLTHRYFNQA